MEFVHDWSRNSNEEVVLLEKTLAIAKQFESDTVPLIDEMLAVVRNSSAENERSLQETKRIMEMELDYGQWKDLLEELQVTTGKVTAMVRKASQLFKNSNNDEEQQGTEEMSCDHPHVIIEEVEQYEDQVETVQDEGMEEEVEVIDLSSEAEEKEEATRSKRKAKTVKKKRGPKKKVDFNMIPQIKTIDETVEDDDLNHEAPPPLKPHDHKLASVPQPPSRTLSAWDEKWWCRCGSCFKKKTQLLAHFDARAQAENCGGGGGGQPEQGALQCPTVGNKKTGNLTVDGDGETKKVEAEIEMETDILTPEERVMLEFSDSGSSI